MNRTIILTWHVLLAFAFSFQVWSTPSTDSLKIVWKNSPVDTVRLEALLSIVTKQFPMHLDSAIHYGQVGEKESRKLKLIGYEGKFLFYQELAHRRKRDYREAVRIGRLAIEAFVLTKQWQWAAGMEREMGDCYIAQTKYDSALLHLFRGMEFDKNENVNPGTAHLSNTIAYVYELMEDPRLSIYWLNQSLQVAITNKFLVAEWKAYFDLGNIYDMLKKYDSALYFKYKSLHLTPKSENDYPVLLGNIANTFIEMGKLDSALRYMKLYTALANSTDYSPHILDKLKARGPVNLGRIYLLKSDFKTAENYLLAGLTQAKKNRDETLIIEAYFNLSKVYEATNKTAEAFKFYRLYESKTDSIFNLEKQKVIQEMTAKYESDKKGQQIKLLQAEATARQQWTIALLASLTLVIVIVISILMRRNLKMKALMAEEKKKAQQDRFKMVLDTEEKERKRIARELHDGIGQMLVTSRLLISDLEETHGDAKATRALHALDASIQEVRTISHNMMPIKLTELGLTEALKDMATTISASEKISATIQVEGFIQLSELVSIPIYRALQEIVNNAIKYSGASKLEIALSQTPENLTVLVSDNGKGFNTNLKMGSGIGLNNVQSRIELIGGSVHVYSKANEGTHVRLVIPIHQGGNVAMSA